MRIIRKNLIPLKKHIRSLLAPQVIAVHLLIVPKRHIVSVIELRTEDAVLIGKMILTAQRLAQEKGLSDDGFRLVFNAGKHSGQVVDHIHLHLLGGNILGDIG